MSKDILSLISSKMNTFSKGQKLIANYILSSYDKAAFMTASKLGKTVHVSESTVVRFASELKYDGYPAMQKELQEMIRNRLTSIQRIEVSNDIIGNQDVVTSVMQSDMEKIRMTMEEIDRESFQAAVDTIINAKKIYILGTRSSGSLAGFMSFYFGLMFDNVVHVGESANQEIFDQIVQVGEGDVTIGLSFRLLCSCMKRAKTSFPLPDSPYSSTLESRGAICSAMVRRFRMATLLATTRCLGTASELGPSSMAGRISRSDKRVW